MTAKKTTLLAALGIIATGIIVGVIYYVLEQYKKVANVGINFLKNKTKINFLGLSKTDITLVFEIVNDSNVTATVDGYQLDIFINGSKVSTAYSQSQNTLNPKGKSTVEVNMVFNPTQVVQVASKNLGDMLSSDKSAVNIEITGKLFGIKSSIITINETPVSYKTTLKELIDSSSTSNT